MYSHLLTNYKYVFLSVVLLNYRISAHNLILQRNAISAEPAWVGCPENRNCRNN